MTKTPCHARKKRKNVEMEKQDKFELCAKIKRANLYCFRSHDFSIAIL